MSNLRVGLAGSGFAARFHLDYFPESGVEVVGVTSPRAESRERFAAAHQLRAFSSVEEMLPHIDVLDICSPPSSHREMILAAAEAGKHVIVEKPLTGFFGSPEEVTKRSMMEKVVEESAGLLQAFEKSRAILGYAENFVYAPAIQKEREILERTKGQILRMTAEESHSGSHSPVYGIWSVQGGGSLIAKGCHPLGAVLYLKRIEGLARLGRPIRPVAATARTHSLTKLPGFENRGFLRTEYKDTEDYAFIHVIFDDGSVADITASELALGGVYDFVEVFANNHRTRCRMSPVNVMDVFSPDKEQLKDVYLMEKITSNAGWVPASPDEGWSRGYAAEFRDFFRSMSQAKQPQSDLQLAVDITLTIYAGYVSAEQKGRDVEVPRPGAADIQ